LQKEGQWNSDVEIEEEEEEEEAKKEAKTSKNGVELLRRVA
jgi:hypothetical protein